LWDMGIRVYTRASEQPTVYAPCMRRMAREEVLDTRARLALFHGTSVSAEQALCCDDEGINYEAMLAAGVKSVNILTAKMGPMALRKRGFDAPSKLRTFGFDALHLCDPTWCNEALMAYGSEAIVSAFLVSAADAVAIAGSESMTMLNVTTSDLIDRCAGFPGEAQSVLTQLPHGASLGGVAPLKLLDAGLRVNALKACGYGLSNLVSQTGAEARDLSKLGFTMG